MLYIISRYTPVNVWYSHMKVLSRYPPDPTYLQPSFQDLDSCLRLFHGLGQLLYFPGRILRPGVLSHFSDAKDDKLPRAGCQTSTTFPCSYHFSMMFLSFFRDVPSFFHHVPMIFPWCSYDFSMMFHHFSMMFLSFSHDVPMIFPWCSIIFPHFPIQCWVSPTKHLPWHHGTGSPAVVLEPQWLLDAMAQVVVCPRVLQRLGWRSTADFHLWKLLIDLWIAMKTGDLGENWWFTYENWWFRYENWWFMVVYVVLEKSSILNYPATAAFNHQQWWFFQHSFTIKSGRGFDPQNERGLGNHS